MNNIEELKRQKMIHGLSDKITNQELILLKKGIPIQKIIGFINFDNLQININHNVLIPRYETEEVLNEALKYINKNSNVLDLCCGSGYIGLSIKQKTQASVTLSDNSEDAIIQTKENAIFNNLDVKIIKSNLFENIDDKFDVIVCNPPYIPQKHKLHKLVYKNEPLNALIGGKDGNKFYKLIIKDFKKYLKKSGVIIFEISNDNYNFLFKKDFTILKDINNKYRIAIKKYN